MSALPSGPSNVVKAAAHHPEKRLPWRHRFRAKNHVDDVNIRNNPNDYKQAAWPALTPVGHGEQNQFTRLTVFRHREGFDAASRIKQDGVSKSNLLAI